jgi:hypothetical protein
MEQITIKVDSDFLEKLKARMTKKGCKTLSQCARELMDLAMRIEDAAQSQEGLQDENDPLNPLIELLKTNLVWSLEIRFLLRFFLENWKEMEPTKDNIFMEKAKERATAAVEKMLLSAKSA